MSILEGEFDILDPQEDEEEVGSVLSGEFDIDPDTIPQQTPPPAVQQPDIAANAGGQAVTGGGGSFADEFRVTPPRNMGEGLNRWQSGFNSFTQRLGKSFLSDFPKAATIISQFALPGTPEQALAVAGLLGNEVGAQATQENITDDPFFQFGEQMGRDIEEMFPENTEFQDEFIARVLPSAMGDLLGVATVGAVTGGLGAGVFAAGNLASQEYEQAINSGADPDTALQAFVLNLPVGATEAIPVGKMLTRLDKVTGGGLKNVLAKGFTGGLEEMIQETVQNSLTNSVAGITYDETRDILDGVGDAAGAGFGVGFLLNALGVSVRQSMLKSTNVDSQADLHLAEEEILDHADQVGADGERINFNKSDRGTPPDSKFSREGFDEGTEKRTISPDEGLPPNGHTSEEVPPRSAEERKQKQIAPPKTFVNNPDDDLGVFKRWFTKWLRPRSLLTERDFKTVMDSKARAQAHMKEAQLRMKEMTTVLQEEFGIKGEDGVKTSGGVPRIPYKIERQINKVLKSGEYNPNLSDRVNDVALEMRSHIDKLSQTLLEEGLVDGRLASKIASNIGVYLHRAYRVNFDPKWVRGKNIPPEVINKAKAFIRDRYRVKENRILSDAELNNVIDNILMRDDAQKSILLDDEFRGVDLSILRDRHSVPAEIRALLGEIKSPIFNYLNTTHKLAKLVTEQQALRDIRKDGMGQIFFENGDFVHPPGYTQTISAGASDVLYPLAGLKTHPDIIEALNNAFGVRKETSATYAAYLKVNGLAKLSKTVLNPITHARNTIGGTMFLLANGHNPLSVKTVSQVAKGLLSKDPKGRKIRWVELGLIDQSVAGGELNDIIKDMEFQSADMMQNFEFFRRKGGSLYQRFLGRPLNEATRLYQAEDNLIRITMFEKELARYKKAMPHVKPGVLEQQVADMVNSTYPNYSRVPRAIKMMRRNVVMAPFVSFPYEVIRTSFNTVKLAQAEMASGNRELQKIGMKRIAGIVAQATLSSTVAAMTAAQLGIDAELEADIDELAPPWDRNGPKAYLGKRDGKVSYINLGYLDPHQVIKGPLLALMFKGEQAAEDAMLESLREFGSNFMGLELTAQAMKEIVANEKSSGGWVTNPAAPFGDKMGDWMIHVYDTFEPGAVRALRRIGSGETRTGRPITREEEFMAHLTGLRVTNVDVGESLRFKALEFNKDRRNAKLILNRAIRSGADDREVRAALGKSNRALARDFKKMRRIREAADKLGLSRKEIDAILKESGLGEEMRDDLRRGKVPEFEIDRRLR